MKTRYGLPGDQEVQRIIGEIDPAASFIRHNQIFDDPSQCLMERSILIPGTVQRVAQNIRLVRRKLVIDQMIEPCLSA